MIARLVLPFALSASILAGTALAQDASSENVLAGADAESWRLVDPENMLLIDLPQGQVVVELRPDFAPLHVEQIKTLVRDGFYNGLDFHRVIEGFAAQGGDPKGDGTGGSSLPNIQAEFLRQAQDVPNFTPIGRDRMAARVGFVDGIPVAAHPESLRSFRADRSVELWPAHCPGAMSMARSTDPNSANSQFFLVIGDARQSLDRRYSIWGWIVDGYENTRRIARGEPPARPTPILRMRIAADAPESDRPKVEVLRTDSGTFEAYLEVLEVARDGLVRDLCAVKVPRRINGDIEL